MNVREVDWGRAAMPQVAPDELSRIFARMSDIAFLVRPDGTIASATWGESRRAQRCFADSIGRPLDDFLSPESRCRFSRALAGLARSPGDKCSVVLYHVEEGDRLCPVRYGLHAVGTEGLVLMLGHDLRVEAEAQEQLVHAQLALEKEFELRRAIEAHYRVILSGTSEAFLFLSADGQIRDLNAAAVDLLGLPQEVLVGAQVSEVLSYAGDMPMAQVLSSVAASEKSCRVAGTVGPGGLEVDLLPTSYRAAGERMIYCRVIPVAKGDREAQRLCRRSRALFLNGPGAIAFTTLEGRIVEANDAFLALADLPGQSDATDRSLADFLHRGEIDLRVILRQARCSGRLENYATRLTNHLGDRSPVSLSATLLDDGEAQLIGFVFQDSEKSGLMSGGLWSVNEARGPGRGAADLVGSATLKEIVAKASDQIERTCIERALEITHDRRAAAAEMLGLSRQSLYVKLRKFGVAERQPDI